jgi:hypothetical protein
MAVHAIEPAAPQSEQRVWRTVGNVALSTLRGGFDVGGGLLVNFGITRAVYVNGSLVTESTVQLNDLSRMNTAQAARLQHQLAALKLVQNGPGNAAPADLASLQHGVVIQNTLSNQHIHAQTIINASSNGLGMLRLLHAQQLVDDAVGHAATTR